MRKFQKALALLLSLAMVFCLMPGKTWAAAAAEVYTILEEPGFHGGFENGTYENVAAVWEAVYYNPDTGETMAARETGIDRYSASISEKTNSLSSFFSSSAVSPDEADEIEETDGTETAVSPGNRMIENAQAESGPMPHTEDLSWQEEDPHTEGRWIWKPMYLVSADKDGLHRISDYYQTLTGLSETGHAAAQNFDGKWGVIDYTGDVVYSFDCNRISELQGYTTQQAEDSAFKNFRHASEGIEKPEVVVRGDNSKTRSYRNGYLVVPDKERSELMDEEGRYILPRYYSYHILSDVSNTGVFWAGNQSEILAVLQIEQGTGAGQITMEADPPIIPVGYDPGQEEYIYDAEDPAEGLELPVEELDKVTDTDSAVDAVKVLLREMTAEQKQSATGIDLATLYAETATMRAASKEVEGDDILINAAMLADLETAASRTGTATGQALANGGITTARNQFHIVALLSDENKLTMRIDPDVLNTKVDSVRVETPTYALTFRLEELKEDLTKTLTFTAEDTGAGFAPAKTKKAAAKPVVKVTVPNGKISNPITVSMPKDTGSKTYQAVVSTNGSATASKYNPATALMDGKVSTSASYTTKENNKDFTDIANKSAEMQKAIRYLASKGIIKGTTETTFSPNGSISRAEIATLIVKALGKLDSSASANFTDVARGSWYYAAAASSQRHGYIQGYGDRTFRGKSSINRVQIIAVSSRVLQKQMGYKTPGSPSAYLSKYSDRVDFWAQSDVALATRENLVVYRKDGTFSGAKNMTRGDAAIIIYRMFQKIW